MILQHNHVNYPKKYKIIKDGRTLNAIKKQGLIIEYCKQFKYIDKYDYSIYQFKFNKKQYEIKYFDGCFNPYLVEVL
jgi:hypothetical protein